MNRIYVFTSTGNGLYAAKRLAEGLDNVEILSMGRLMQKDHWSIEGERVGFVFPCYYGESPQLLRRFIERAERVEAHYCFGLVTAGGSQGRGLVDLNRALCKRNSKLNYAVSYNLVSNYMPGWYYNMIWPSEKELQRRQQREEKVLQRGAKDIANLVDKRPNFDVKGYVMPKIISPGRYIKDTRLYDREFSIGNNCTACGTCSKACPVNNISMDSGKPRFQQNCQRCTACMHYCPQRSISILGKPMNKRTYRHSQVSNKELFDFHRKGRL